MKHNISIHSLINEHLSHLTIKIWISNLQDPYFEEVYTNGNIEVLPLPNVTFVQNKSRYNIDVQSEMVYIYFYYPDDYRVIVCTTKFSYSYIKMKLEGLYSLFYLLYQQKALQVKDTELENLIVGTRSISSLDLEECLEKIISNALAVIPPADAGYLLLYDCKTNELQLKSSIGFNHRIKHFKTKIGESITGKTFQDGNARLYCTNDEVLKEMDNNQITEENLNHLISSSDVSSLQAMLCAPVSVGDKRIGVLAIHQFYEKGKLVNRDLKMLQAFADQAAIAIQNASLYNKTKMQLKDVTVLSQQLKENNEFLLKREEIHETLTRCSLQNKGANIIVSEIKRMVNTPIFFMNYLDDEYFPKHKNNQPPFSNDELSLIFSNRRSSVYIDLFDNHQPGVHSNNTYYLYPITNGSVFLGCLILNIGKKLSKLDQTTIEHGASILSLELVKHQNLIEVYYKKTHEYFNELLQNKQPPEVIKAKGKEFGLNLSAYLCVTVFEVLEYTDLKQLEAMVHLLVSTIKKHMKHREILVFGFNNKVTILASFPNSSIVKFYTGEIKSILRDWINREGAPLSAGIGKAYQGIALIERSYNEATKALYYLKTRNRSEMIQYEDIGVNRLFLNQSRFEIDAFSREILAPLTSESSELRETLFTYISTGRSVTETAKKLHVHVNTIYKRLTKIEELLNLHFDQPEDLLTIQLVCHLKENF